MHSQDQKDDAERWAVGSDSRVGYSLCSEARGRSTSIVTGDAKGESKQTSDDTGATPNELGGMKEDRTGQEKKAEGQAYFIDMVGSGDTRALVSFLE